MTWDVSISIALILLATAVAVAPILRYLILGWSAKRADIMDSQNEEARRAYFEMFSRNTEFPDGSHKKRVRTETAADSDRAKAEKQSGVYTAFENLYTKWYGRRLFTTPLVLFIIVSLVLGSIVIPCRVPLLGLLSCCGMSVEPSAKLTAAVAGAYLWVVNDFTSRARRLDFAPSDVHWGVLRFVISIPMANAFASLVTDGLQPFIAFSIGAFPLATLMTMLRRVATDKLGFQETKEEADDGIVKLQGINRDILERLANEDITTITQFAYCDPVRLTMRSNLTFNFVTDCMNQALAWVYLEDKMKDIRCFGLKGAVEIKHLLDDMERPDEASSTRAVAAFATVAETLKQTPETLMNAFREIAQDPFTLYLYEVWE